MDTAGLCPGRRKKKSFPLVLFVLAGFFIPASCSRDNAKTVLMPPLTNPLARDILGYGVVNVSFTHVRNEPGEENPSLGYLRKGSLVKITERRSMSGGRTSWVYVVYEDGTLEGWLNENIVEIYDNESRALTASRMAE